MATLLAPAFGNGSDGVLSISSNTTQAPVDSSCSGSSGATSLTATNASFAAGQLILIHQTMGTGVGVWELNKIASYVAGTITVSLPLANTYTDSGNSQAQVIVIPQYSSATVDSGKTWTAKAWDGNVGGILAFACSGKATITGTIQAGGNNASSGTGGVGIGFDGGRNDAAGGGGSQTAEQGDGSSGVASFATTANGSGGGGGYENGSAARAGGGGGGNGAAGSNGSLSGTGTAGTGGSTSGAADLTTMTFGGGGGGSASATPDDGGGGGAGGGIILALTKEIEVTGYIKSNGGTGAAGGGASPSGGGGGAGGSILIKAQKITAGTNLITATAGSGAGTISGGAGGVGRIRIEAQTISGTTNPAASELNYYFGADHASMI